MSQFDAMSELIRLRTNAGVRRKTHYRKSRLDRYAGELLQLYRAGARAADLQRWLKEQRVAVTHSTVARWLQKNG